VTPGAPRGSVGLSGPPAPSMPDLSHPSARPYSRCPRLRADPLPTPAPTGDLPGPANPAGPPRTGRREPQGQADPLRSSVVSKGDCRSFGVAEDRNLLVDCGTWVEVKCRPSFGAAEDRNHALNMSRCLHNMWRSSFGAAEDRNEHPEGGGLYDSRGGRPSGRPRIATPSWRNGDALSLRGCCPYG
jgi:hypothetical protein